MSELQYDEYIVKGKTPGLSTVPDTIIKIHRNCPKTKAAVINGEYLTGCSQCLNTTTQSADYSAKWRRERSKDDHRADIVQRYAGDKINPEWVKLHEKKAREALGDKAVEDILRK